MLKFSDLKSFLLKQRVLFAIFLAALFFRVFLFACYWHNNGVSVEQIVQGDATEYHILAHNLIEKGEFTSGSEANSRRTPIYPFFIGSVYLIFGELPWVVLLFQLIIDSLTAVLIFILGQAIFDNKKASIIAAALYAFDPLVALYSYKLLTETLFIFLFVIFLLFLFLAIKRRRIKLFVLSGLFLSLAILTRPITQYFFVIGSAAIFLLSGEAMTRRLKYSVLFLAAFLLTILPWQIRNYVNFGSFALSNLPGYNLLQYSAAIPEAAANKINIEEARDKLRLHRKENSSSVADSKLDQSLAVKYIAQHPIQVIGTNAKGVLNIFLNTVKYELFETFGVRLNVFPQDQMYESIPARIKRVLQTARREYFMTPVLLGILLIEYLLGVGGVIYLFKKKNVKVAFVFFCIIAYFCVATGALGSSRFRIPMVPVYLLLSGLGAVFFWEYFRAKLGFKK
jgi:4-amino-4-deoxy-L-arabinose transferase-like glycosyltransferase